MPAEEIGKLTKNPREILSAPAFPGPQGKPVGLPGLGGRFLAATVVLVLCFGVSLFNLARFAFQSDLYSYVLLMPFVSLHLVLKQRDKLRLGGAARPGLGAVFWIAGLAVLAGRWLAGRYGSGLSAEDHFAFIMSSFLLLLAGNCCFFLPRPTLRACAFPLALLAFMVPLPTVLRISIESFLQYGSALAADGMFSLTRTEFIREGLIFILPDITLQVAPECSGIHSSLILFITSILAGNLFLRTPWKRTVLVLAVIPLGLLRNGFRIFTLGQLCIHIGPDMIHSVIHTRGGPLFFVLSLVPFFLLLLALQRSDRAGREACSESPKP